MKARKAMCAVSLGRTLSSLRREVITACCLLSAAMCYGEANFPAALTSPAIPAPKLIAVDSLAPEVRREIARFTDGAFSATEVETILLDLNADGTMELLIADPASYTGGQMWWIFGPSEAGHPSLGAFQGTFYLAAPRDEWFQIVTDSRAPGGFIRSLFVFQDGGYRSVRETEYSLSEDGQERFLRELQPRR